MSEIVSEPVRQHFCGPNRHGVWLEHCADQPGTVRQCECGRTWVAWRNELDPGYMGVYHRREGRVARWLRERRRP